MAGKDVDLVIRARDKASAELAKISKALKQNVSEMQDTAKGAGQMSGALGKLAADASKFEGELNKLKSAGKVAAELDKATASVSRMEGSLKTNATELAKMARESDNAAQAASRLKGQLAAEESALSSNKAGLAASRKELTEVNKLVREAERNQERYNKALGTTPDHFVRPAAKSAGAFIAADLPAQKAAQAAVNTQVREYQAQIERSTAAIKEMRPQVSAAASLQNSLATETSRASQALASERDDLGKARAELEAIRGVSAQAGAALGTVAISQEQVSAASQRMAANLAATKARIEGLSNIKTTTAASSTAAVSGGVDVQALAGQRRAVLEARREWVAAQTDVKALAQQIKSTTTPTEALGTAFGTAQAKAHLASDAYDAQRAKLAALKGQQGDLAAFLTRTATAQQQSASAFVSAQANIARGGSAAATSQQQLAPAIRASGTALGSATSQTNAFGSALSKLQGESRKTASTLEGLSGQLVSLAAGYVGLQAAFGQIGGAVNSYRQLEAAQSRLGAAFNQDTSKVSAEIQFLQQTADRLGISFGTLADEYGKFTVAAKIANFTTAETRKVFLSVAEAARVNKLSTEQTSGVFLALTQMISKGKVTAEELRGQLGERLTGAFGIFADAIGKTTAELDAMMQKGEVLADRSTLLKFADEMNQKFAPQLASSLESVSTDIGRFENSVFNAQLSLASGFVPALRSALQSFNDFAQSSSGQDTFINLGKAIGDVIRVLAEVPKYFDLITSAAKAFVLVKVAETLTAVVGKAVQTTQAISAFSRELQLIGPRTQAAASSQSALTRGLAQTVSTLGSFRGALLSSTSQSVVARAGVVGLAGAVGTLQAALVTTAGVARAFLAAFGGPIGIAITAITFAVGHWMTSVDQATAALSEHKRQMDVIVAAYDAAGDKAGDWAKKIVGVTMAQALENQNKLQSEFNKLLDSAISKSRVLYAGVADFPDTSKQIQQFRQIEAALSGVKDGSKSLGDLKDVLNDIALNPAEEQFKEIALELLNMVNNAGEGETSLTDLADAIARAEAGIRLMNDTATDADKALVGTAKAAQDAAEKFDYQGKTTAFNKLLNEMKENIPGMADELKKLEALKGLDKQYQDAMKLATTMGQIVDATKSYSQAVAGINSAVDQKPFDSLPDSRGRPLKASVSSRPAHGCRSSTVCSRHWLSSPTRRNWSIATTRLMPGRS
jgi:tape measure domain-containing protein